MLLLVDDAGGRCCRIVRIGRMLLEMLLDASEYCSQRIKLVDAREGRHGLLAQRSYSSVTADQTNFVISKDIGDRSAGAAASPSGCPNTRP